VQWFALELKTRRDTGADVHRTLEHEKVCAERIDTAWLTKNIAKLVQVTGLESDGFWPPEVKRGQYLIHAMMENGINPCIPADKDVVEGLRNAAAFVKLKVHADEEVAGSTVTFCVDTRRTGATDRANAFGKKLGAMQASAARTCADGDKSYSWARSGNRPTSIDGITACETMQALATRTLSAPTGTAAGTTTSAFIGKASVKVITGSSEKVHVDEVASAKPDPKTGELPPKTSLFTARVVLRTGAQALTEHKNQHGWKKLGCVWRYKSRSQRSRARP
jgi:hypothetical protein